MGWLIVLYVKVTGYMSRYVRRSSNLVPRSDFAIHAGVLSARSKWYRGNPSIKISMPHKNNIRLFKRAGKAVNISYPKARYPYNVCIYLQIYIARLLIQLLIVDRYL